MPGQDGSRAISTINFLLDDKAPGTKLEHTWNAHLKTACRDDTRGSLNLLNLFTSDCDEPADSTAADPDSSTALQDASAPQDPSPAANSEGPRQQQQQQQQPLPAEAVAGGPAPACSAAAGGAQAAAPSTPAQDAAAAPSTVQEAVNTTAAADGGLAAASCTPQQLSGSSDSKGSGQAEAAPAQQHSSPAPEQPANGVSTVAGPPTSVLNPMQAATGAKPAAESPAPPAQVAEDEDAEEEYRKVHKALNLLRHVQASTKLPQCLQPPKRPQLTLHSTPVPAVNTASTGNNNNNNSSSSSSAGGSMALDAATSKPSTAAAGSETPAGDGVDVLLTARRSSSTNDSHSSAAGKLHLPLGACTSSASFSNGPKSSRAPTQQPHHQPHRSRSFTSPAAAAAAAGAPSSGAAPGAPARRHTNGAAAAIASSSAAVPLAALYEPTLEDLKPYLKGALSGEGVEAFIQRRLQQPPDVACQAGAKLAKLPATQRYMATIAVEHKQRQQLQRLPSAAAGEQRRQHG